MLRSKSGCLKYLENLNTRSIHFLAGICFFSFIVARDFACASMSRTYFAVPESQGNIKTSLCTLVHCDSIIGNLTGIRGKLHVSYSALHSCFWSQYLVSYNARHSVLSSRSSIAQRISCNITKIVDRSSNNAQRTVNKPVLRKM